MRRLSVAAFSTALMSPAWRHAVLTTSSTGEPSLSHAAVHTQQRANSSLSSSSSSPSSLSRRARHAHRASLSRSARVDELGVQIYADDVVVTEGPAVVVEPSAVDRLIQRQNTSLPWEARHATVSYKVCSTDWKFLDRALSALMEMDAEEVSTRSVKLSGRDLLTDVAHPVAALRQASKKHQAPDRTVRPTSKRRRTSVVHAAAQAVQRSDAPLSGCVTSTTTTTTRAVTATLSDATGTAPVPKVRRARRSQKHADAVPAPVPAATEVKTAAVSEEDGTSQPVVKPSATTPKTRRRGKRTTVHL